MRVTFIFAAVLIFFNGISQERLDLDLPHNQRGYIYQWSKKNPLTVNPEHVLKLDCRKAKNIDSLLTELPKFKNIEWLSLYGLNLKELPDIFDNFPFLVHIDIANNQLTELPPSFNSFIELEYAHLNSNKLSELPSLFYELELKELLIAGNAFSDTFTIATSWNNLTQLNVGGNPIGYIEGIEHLHKIEHFSLTSCMNLSKLPDTFKKCKKLKFFYVDNTALSSLPKSLLKLNTLYYILLENTKIPNALLYEYRVLHPKKVFDDCPVC